MIPQFPSFNPASPEAVETRLKNLLPPEHYKVIETIREFSLNADRHFYLVGGIVRDLILGRINLDLDFITLENALDLAPLLASLLEPFPGLSSVKLTSHSEFKTARLGLKFQNGLYLKIDLATARREIYSFPGALPTLSPGFATLAEDLFRRDFTINSMALSLVGELIDPLSGMEDLRNGLLRILHPASFKDDPTRMVRGVRFCGRMGYTFEPVTLSLLMEGIKEGFLRNLTPQRRRNELRLVLEETRPEKTLSLLENFNLLKEIHPLLGFGIGHNQSFIKTRLFLNKTTSELEHLAILLYSLEPEKVERVAEDLRFSGEEKLISLQLSRLWHQVRPLLQDEIKNSRLFALLTPFDRPGPVLSLFEALLNPVDPEAGARIAFYRENLQGKKPLTGGDFLSGQLGLTSGPEFKVLLGELHRAVLDGEVNGRFQEEEFLRLRLKN